MSHTYATSTMADKVSYVPTITVHQFVINECEKWGYDEVEAWFASGMNPHYDTTRGVWTWIQIETPHTV